MARDDLSERVRRLVTAERRCRLLSLRDVGDESGVSFNVIARLERGRFQRRSLSVIERLVDWCGYRIEIVPKPR